MSRARRAAWLLVGAVFAMAASGRAPAATTTRVAAGLAQPVFATAPPGDLDRLFVVERMPARIRLIDLATDTLRSQAFLTIPGATGEGLRGLAFHPDHASNGKLYVYYVAQGGIASVVEEYEIDAGDPQRADPGSARTILSFDQPQISHSGGWIGFGPDACLYIMTGDGGGLLHLDARDLCPVWPDPDHADRDGNGVGNACECDDQTGDGTVDIRDVLAISRASLGPETGIGLGYTNDDQRCDVEDILGAHAKTLGDEACCSRSPAPPGEHPGSCDAPVTRGPPAAATRRPPAGPPPA